MGGFLEAVWQSGCELGEGPVWIEDQAELLFVDIKQQFVYRFSPDMDRKESWYFPEQVTSIVPCSDAGYLCTHRNGLGRLDLDISRIKLLNRPEQEPENNRFNDGKLDRSGRYWVGTMDDKESARCGTLYRFDDRGLVAMDRGYGITNGPALSSDGKILYHTETLDRTIYAFDLDEAGGIANKRPFIVIPEDFGYPDGMTVDQQGYIWVALFAGWGLHRYTPGGALDQVVDMPVANVTSCCFGGSDLRTLYITTARKGLSDAELEAQPLAGSLFALKTNTQGIPDMRFPASWLDNSQS